MPKTRWVDHAATTISNRRQKTCRPGEKKMTPSEDCGQGVWRKLGEGPLASILSPSVVALASFNGKTMRSSCTGIVVRTEPLGAFQIIATSFCLFRDCNKAGLFDFTFGLMIKVRLPNNQVVPGRLFYYDFERYTVFITTMELFPDIICPARLNHDIQVELHDEIAAVRRCFKSGKLMSSIGVPIGRPSEVNDLHRDSKELMFSTCKINATGSGGPLVDSNGNIVGMNLYPHKMSPFLPSNQILACLGPDWRTTSLNNREVCILPLPIQGGRGLRKRTTNKTQKSSMPYVRHPEGLVKPELSDYQSRILRALQPWESEPPELREERDEMILCLGYPLPTYFDGGMKLRGAFEEEFGEDPRTEFTKKVAVKMSRTVVSLASFNGKSRFFACSGVFINRNGGTTRVLTSASLVRTSGNENKIHHNLRIEVCLPSKRHVIGTLEHYNLCYNVAVVSIRGSCRDRVAKLDGSPLSEVVALGCGFESGKLMATRGVVTDKRSIFSCKELMVSTCQITKVGIGGPLVDFDANFIGMNFYDMEETPYLPRDKILELLEHFDAKGTVADAIMDECTYRWPVPDPYWHYPSVDCVEEDDCYLE